MMNSAQSTAPNVKQSAKVKTSLKDTAMTRLVDAVFIRAGFDRGELLRSNLRGSLYVGMVYMAGLASAFLIMAVFG